MSFNLQGKTALVTGASRGIGAAIARRLAQDGAEVVVHYGEGAAEAQTVANAIEAAGGKAHVTQADLAAADGATQLAQKLATTRIDILVNNAGIAPAAPAGEMDEATFDRLANVNMRSVFLLTQQLLSRIPVGGRIINISSAVTRTGIPGMSAYAATKGFIDVLTLQLAGELGARGITVNAVAPGAIDTRMSAWIHGPGGADTLKQMQALAGIGRPEYIAGVVSFLAGPDGRWTTGQVIDASGGTRL